MSHIFIGEREAYYHTVIYFVLKLIGAEVRPEEESNIGRLDAVLETNNLNKRVKNGTGEFLGGF